MSIDEAEPVLLYLLNNFLSFVEAVHGASPPPPLPLCPPSLPVLPPLVSSLLSCPSSFRVLPSFVCFLPLCDSFLRVLPPFMSINEWGAGSHPSWSTFLRYCNICFFLVFLLCPKVLYLKYYINYHTSEVHTGSQKRGISPPKNEGQAKLHPPVFITTHTPPVHGGV
jgi:hypothetical protein